MKEKLKADLVVADSMDGYCIRAPGRYIECINGYRCSWCILADRFKQVRLRSPTSIPAIDNEISVLQKKRDEKGLVYYKKVVAVLPKSLERLGRRPLLYYQFFFCQDGPGCLPSNPYGEIDGYFLSDPQEAVTLTRADILGIPKASICKTFDDHFYMNTLKACGHI